MRPIRPRLRAGLLAAALLLAGCAEFAQNFYRPNEGPVGEKHAPVLKAVWAQDEIGNGASWRIYVRAQDPDGDLDKVYVTFHQPGAIWPQEFVILPQSQRRQANGSVLFWVDMKSLAATIWAEAHVVVEDRAGNMSEVRKIEFAVVSMEKEDASAPPLGFEGGVHLGQMEFPLHPFNAEGGATPS